MPSLRMQGQSMSSGNKTGSNFPVITQVQHQTEFGNLRATFCRAPRGGWNFPAISTYPRSGNGPRHVEAAGR